MLAWGLPVTSANQFAVAGGYPAPATYTGSRSMSSRPRGPDNGQRRRDPAAATAAASAAAPVAAPEVEAAERQDDPVPDVEAELDDDEQLPTDPAAGPGVMQTYLGAVNGCLAKETTGKAEKLIPLGFVSHFPLLRLACCNEGGLTFFCFTNLLFLCPPPWWGSCVFD